MVGARAQSIIGAERVLDDGAEIVTHASRPAERPAGGIFDIEKGIPAPLSIGAGAKSVYRESLKLMTAIDDFFFVPNATDSAGGTIRSHAADLKIKVTIRRNFTHRGKKGLGVWRVE